MSDLSMMSPRDRAKKRATELRRLRAADGAPMSQAQALEQVARELGFRDWNTASARLSNQPEPALQIGDSISGHYLKQAFTGRVIALHCISDGRAFEVGIHFDEPVDVVSWPSFSSHRQRVHATVGPDGRSWEKTSDGVPHMVLAL